MLNRLGRTIAVVAIASASYAFAQSTRPATTGLAPGASITDTMEIPAAGTTAPRRVTPASPAAAAPSTNAASAGPANSIGFDLTRMAIALVIVLALILLARWFFAQMFAGSRAPAASRAIKVLGRTSIAPRQQVLLLQVGGRVIVVGDSNGNLATLANLDDPDEVAMLVGQLQQEQISRAASFGGLFGRAERKFDEEAAGDGSPTAASGPSSAPDDEAQARSELSGLVEKVRSMRNQMNTGQMNKPAGSDQ